MTDKILIRIMIGSIIGMLLTTGFGMWAVGFDHINDLAPTWVNNTMWALGTVMLVSIFWFLIIWSGFSQKPVSDSKTNDKTNTGQA